MKSPWLYKLAEYYKIVVIGNVGLFEISIIE